jgi:hypothetical protein
MMKKITLLITVLISVLNTEAQNDLWPTDAINTGSNSTYLIVDVSSNGGDLIYGKLGAFFTNDDGVLQNGGYVLWNNEQTNVAAWGDDVSNDSPEKDGFDNDEEITWLATYDDGVTTYEATVEYQVGGNNYLTNGVNVISLLTISNTVYCVNDADGDGICDENETSGCTDPSAINYNADAEVDDGSCIDAVLGCTDESADNYNPDANSDDDSCFREGCMNESAANYDPLATVDDETCIIDGCMDATAFNYNADATVDDGSCLGTVNIQYDSVVVTSSTTVFNIAESTVSFSLGDSVINSEDVIGAFQIINNELVCVGYSNWSDEDISIELAQDDVSTTEVDGYVSTEPIYWIANQENTGVNYLLEVTINEANFITDITVNANVTFGCTDPNAVNYNSADGVIEDGSCVSDMSINDLIDNGIVLYPNPVNSVINITSNNSNIHSFDLYNAIGVRVISISDINSKVMTVNRNELNSGIYISKITDTDGNTVVRNIIFE